MTLQENVNFKQTCGSCRHYIGGGDWNLCCDLPHEDYPCGFLCYKDTVACDQYVFSQATIDREEEKRIELARYVRELVEKANRKMGEPPKEAQE